MGGLDRNIANLYYCRPLAWQFLRKYQCKDLRISRRYADALADIDARVSFLNEELDGKDLRTKITRRLFGKACADCYAGSPSAGIDEINRQIEELVAQRKCLEYDLEQYDSLLSPIKRIPVEILSKIFHDATVVPGEARVQPTVVTSTVCKTWRKLAIDTPTLWTNIVIRIPKHPRLEYRLSGSLSPVLIEEEEHMWNRRVEKLLVDTPLWLDRSKECPISLMLRFNTVDKSRRQNVGWDGLDVGPYRALVDFACSVAHRWKELDLDISTRDETIVQPILSLEPHHVPRLESISFQTEALRDGSDPPFYPSKLLGAPSIRSAFLLYIDRPWVRIPIHWRGLRKLRFAVQEEGLGVGDTPWGVVERMMSPLRALSLFQACPDLEECELAVMQPVEGDVSHKQHLGSSGVLRMEHLSSLKFHKSEAVEELMSVLELPALRQLHFLASRLGEVNMGKRSTRARSFLFVVDRFGAQLTDVRFNLLLLEDTDSVTSCFSNLPNLLNLQLDSVVPHTQLFGQPAMESLERSAQLLLSLLTPDIGQSGASVVTLTCPKLKRFACTLRIKGFTERQLLEFIISRSIQGNANAGFARIKEVDVAFGIVQRMDIGNELEKEGVDIGSLRLRIQYPKAHLLLGLH